MKHRTFFWFFLPTALAMVLFILFPIVSVITQSLYIDHEQIFVEVESCDIFGCRTESAVDHEATEQLRKEEPLGRFVGLANYVNRSHLAFSEISSAWQSSEGFVDFFKSVYNLPLYRAITFTLVYTFTVTPLLILFGFFIAIGVNALHKSIKGFVIFFSLLPMIVTPLVGSLILFWMIDSRGIIGNSLQDRKSVV